MQKRKFTVVTQLHEKNNLELIKYIEASRSEYAKAVRETFYTLRTSENFNKSNFNAYLQCSYQRKTVEHFPLGCCLSRSFSDNLYCVAA